MTPMTKSAELLFEPLLFDETAHRYTVGGRDVPAVSRIIKTLEDLSDIPPGVLAAKGALGTAVHACCELLDQGDLDDDTVRPEWRPYVDAYRMFLDHYQVEWQDIEQRHVNRVQWYAGTVDRFGRLRRRGTEEWTTALVDLKTRLTLPPIIGVQLAAYEHLHPGYLGAARFALQLRKDGTYNLATFDSQTDWPTFLGCLAIHKFRTTHRIGE